MKKQGQVQPSPGKDSGRFGDAVGSPARRHVFDSPAPPSIPLIGAKTPRLLACKGSDPRRDHFFRGEISVKLPAWITQEKDNLNSTLPVLAGESSNGIQKPDTKGEAGEQLGGGMSAQETANTPTRVSLITEQRSHNATRHRVRPGPMEDSIFVKIYKDAVAELMLKKNLQINTPATPNQKPKELNGTERAGSSEKEPNPLLAVIEPRSDTGLDEPLPQPQLYAPSSPTQNHPNPTLDDHETSSPTFMEIEGYARSDPGSDDEVQRPQFSSPFLQRVVRGPSVPPQTPSPVAITESDGNRGGGPGDKLDIEIPALAAASPTQPATEVPVDATTSTDESPKAAKTVRCEQELGADKLAFTLASIAQHAIDTSVNISSITIEPTKPPETIGLENGIEAEKQTFKPVSPTQPAIEASSNSPGATTEVLEIAEIIGCGNSPETGVEALTPASPTQPAKEAPTDCPTTTQAPVVTEPMEYEYELETNQRALSQAATEPVDELSVDHPMTAYTPVTVETVGSHSHLGSGPDTDNIAEPEQTMRSSSPMDTTVDPPVPQAPPSIIIIESDSELGPDLEIELEPEGHTTAPLPPAESPARKPALDQPPTPSQCALPGPQPNTPLVSFSPILHPIKPKAPEIARFLLGDPVRWRDPVRVTHNRFSGPRITTPLRAAPLQPGLGQTAKSGWPQHEGSWQRAHEDVSLTAKVSVCLNTNLFVQTMRWLGAGTGSDGNAGDSII